MKVLRAVKRMFMLSKQRIRCRITQKAKILEDCYHQGKGLSELVIAGAMVQRKKLEETIFFEFQDRQIRAKKTRREQLKRIKTEYETGMEQANQAFSESVNNINNEVIELQKSDGWSAIDFNYELWNIYLPLKTGVGAIPKLTRIGNLAAHGKNRSLKVPALVPIIGGQHVFIKASGDAMKAAVAAMQCLLLRLLAGLPPGQIRLILIDPASLGLNLSAFMELPEELRGTKPLTESADIDEQLIKLTDRMELITQNHLRHRYDNVEEYNKQAGEMAEPYRIVAIVGFPQGFTDSAASRLVRIARNGPRTGVHIIAIIDKDTSLPYGFALSELEQTGVVIDFVGDQFVWQDDAFKNWSLELDRLPSLELFDRIVRSVGGAAEEAMEVKIPFEKIVPDSALWWSGDSRSGLSAPIGKTVAGEELLFELGINTAHHGLIGGDTGFGKSILLHVIINSLAITYSHDELELYLCDFKEGVEFKDYAEYQLPHLRVIGIESDPEYGLSILRALDEELQRRGKLFKDARVSNIQEYRDKYPDERMPRILLIVDEYQEFFHEDDHC